MLKQYQHPRGPVVQSSPQRIANGRDMMAAADAIRREQKRRDQWPFPHVYPPTNSQRRDPNGYTAAPAVGAQAVVLAFSVPSGFFFFLSQLGLFYQGATAGFGDFTFTVDKNTPLGAPSFQSSPLNDWSAINFPVGGILQGPVTLPRVEVFAPEDLIQAKVLNNAIAAGAPNYFGAWFGGWLVPAIEVPNVT